MTVGGIRNWKDINMVGLDLSKLIPYLAKSTKPRANPKRRSLGTVAKPLPLFFLLRSAMTNRFPGFRNHL